MKILRKIPFFALMALIVFTIPLKAQGFLHRTGKYIYNGAGEEVILRGIGTGNWMIQEGYMMQTSGVAGTQHELRAKLISTIGEVKTDSFYTVWLDSHFRRIDVDSMKSWGFNSVRVAMHYKWFTPPIEDEPVPGGITWIDKGFTMIDSLLDWCSDNEMYLILDLHGAPGGQGQDSNISDYDSSKPSLWESTANKNKTIALWRKLAERYANEPWIGGYDLINEPNWTLTNNTDLVNLYKAITTAIREVDLNHIIILEGNWFANDYTGFPSPWDNNMVYSFHKYWDNPTQESFNNALTLRNSKNVPVWLGESGENSNTWFTNAIALCEKNHIGWSWWPVKKPGINNVLKVNVNSDYTQLVNYWKGTAAKPSVDAAFNAVLQFALNHRLENCTVQRDVIDAMFRQTTTAETIPWKLYHTSEPVFAANYNLGRNTFAYYDTDTANIGGASSTWNQGWSYRNDGVDLEKCTDSDANMGFSVGWTNAGEWMEYTVQVDSTAAYTLSVRSAGGSGIVHLEVNDVAVSKGLTLPSTAGSQVWKTTLQSGVILNKGINKIRLVLDKGGCNLNYFSLSDPMDASTVPFEVLHAQTSDDGSKVYLSLNKPVTSSPGEIGLNDFTVIINSIPVEITSVNEGQGGASTLAITVAEPLYYQGTITLSYQGTTILSEGQTLQTVSKLPVTNNLPVRYTITSRIQAEDFAVNNGMSPEDCTDTNGGYDMGNADANDYLDYRVYVSQAKYYNINVRVATTGSGQLILRRGEGTTFVALDTIAITSTGGWQSWKTVTGNTFLPEGRYTLRLFIKQGPFNINWFQGVGVSGVGVKSEDSGAFGIYPNPAKDYCKVALGAYSSGKSDINIFNAVGNIVRSIETTGQSEVIINTGDLNKGLYFVKLKNQGFEVSVSKLIIL